MERLHIQFRYKRGDVVEYTPWHTRCTIIGQRYQTRDILGPLVTYLVDSAQGGYCWVHEEDLVALEVEQS